MKAPGYLFDSNVLANLFLEREPFSDNAAHLWDLAIAGKIEGYVTQKALKDIYDLLEEQRGSKWALKAAKYIGQVMNFCPINSEMLREASAFNLENLRCAIQLVCANHQNLAGIVTPDFHSFRCVDLGNLEILTPGELSVRHMEEDEISGEREKFERQLLESTFALRHVIRNDISKQRQRFEMQLLESPLFDNQVLVLGDWCLGAIKIHCGSIARSKATVTIRNGKGEKLSCKAEGNGPIDAAYKAINQLLVCLLPRLDHRLLNYCVKSVGEGEDAIGKATVILKCPNSGFQTKGSSSHTDIILASIYAYISALNTAYNCVENSQPE
jgi:predicted nucleic acid-binding protein